MKMEMIIKEFNNVMKQLLDNGYMFCPHDYSCGTKHEHFIKGTELKRIRLERHSAWSMKDTDLYADTYILTIDTRQLDKREIQRVIDGDSPWNNSDDLYEVKEIKRYYQVGFKSAEWFVDNREEWIAINEKCNQRSGFDKYYYLHRNDTVVLPDKAKEIVLSFMRRQYKCKSIKLSDITAVEKHCRPRSSKPVQYVVYAKGKSYVLR